MTGDDWKPLPGTTKRTCNRCLKPFSSRGTRTCANCQATKKPLAEGPFDPVIRSSVGRGDDLKVLK